MSHQFALVLTLGKVMGVAERYVTWAAVNRGSSDGLTIQMTLLFVAGKPLVFIAVKMSRRVEASTRLVLSRFVLCQDIWTSQN